MQCNVYTFRGLFVLKESRVTDRQTTDSGVFTSMRNPQVFQVCQLLFFNEELSFSIEQ